MRRTVILGAALAGVALAAAPLFRAEAAPVCPRAEDSKYVGAKNCLACHFKQHLSWQKKPKAKALEALKPGAAVDRKKEAGLDPAKDYSKDPACVKCHVTGYGLPGGYPEIVEGKAWTPDEQARAKLNEGVGCESCHGPGEASIPFKKANKEYKWAEVAKLGMHKPTAEVCAKCHNKESPTFRPFDFEARRKDGAHDFVPLKFKHE